MWTKDIKYERNLKKYIDNIIEIWYLISRDYIV